jgi:ribonuclease HII
MPNLSLEQQLYRQGIQLVAGVDEAGRGPLAGPVVAAAVVLPNDLSGDEFWLRGINDSKKLSARQRERAADLILEHAWSVGIGQQSPQEIDRLGIGNACIQAMLNAVADLTVTPGHLLLDYVPIKQCPYLFDAIVKGDSRSYSIAAASIVAKVTRDRWMVERAEVEYPGYSFARHKGYPTADHRDTLQRRGPCPIHRRSFAPVRLAEQLCRGG